MATFSRFKGLNNVTDPMRLDMAWLTQADNVHVTDTGALTKRDGYALARSGDFRSAYSTLDHSRLYLATANQIQTHDGRAVYSLTSDAPLYWAEVNGNVYFNNGADSGVIGPDHEVTAWRGAPVSDGAGFKDADGTDREVLYDTLPTGADVIQHWKGRMYAAQWLASEDQTVIWFSEPLGYHLFSLDSNFLIVPGRVLMLAPHPDALLIGTDRRIHAYTDDGIAQLADYGVVAGQHWSADGARVLFWTRRGLCAALPLQNITERQVSVAPGVRAGGCVVQAGGQKHYLTSIQQGGQPFNAL